MQKISYRQKFHYFFDNTLSKGTIALIAWLAIVSFALIVVIAGFVFVTNIAPVGEDGSSLSFSQLAWMGLMRTLDSGTMGGDTGSWPFLFAMLSVTLAGIFVVSTLIGVLTSGLEGKIDELRKGRTLVIEKNHTIILGWSEQVFAIIAELIEANSNQRYSCITIMAEKDKVEMEDEIRAKIEKPGRTRIVCRSGSPMDVSDIDIVSPQTSKSIIILAPETTDPDSQVIKTILAITNHPARRADPYHIIAEIRDEKTGSVIDLIAKNEVTAVLAGDLISRIMVQTCRQSGLSIVYTELLDFGGDEIYFKDEPEFAGKTFGDAVFAYEDSSIIGIFDKDGHVKLNPPQDTQLTHNDQLIAISADDDTIVLSGRSDFKIRDDVLVLSQVKTHAPEKTLILGWNTGAPAIINELDKYVAPNSQVSVVAQNVDLEAEIKEHCRLGVKNQKIQTKTADTTERDTLEALDLKSFNHVITLSYSDTLEPQAADARTLITLLHLRDIATRQATTFSIVSEMLDVRNRELALVTRADDFIVSNKLVALMLSQLAENKNLKAVFTDLFDPEGSEIYLKPITDYIKPGIDVNFYTLLKAALTRNEVAIGYKLQSQKDDKSKSFGVKVNPKKSEMINFGPDDKIIVLAES